MLYQYNIVLMTARTAYLYFTCYINCKLYSNNFMKYIIHKYLNTTAEATNLGIIEKSRLEVLDQSVHIDHIGWLDKLGRGIRNDDLVTRGPLSDKCVDVEVMTFKLREQEVLTKVIHGQLPVKLELSLAILVQLCHRCLHLFSSVLVICYFNIYLTEEGVMHEAGYVYSIQST